jgi:hypothetical protein
MGLAAAVLMTEVWFWEGSGVEITNIQASNKSASVFNLPDRLILWPLSQPRIILAIATGARREQHAT